MTTIKVCQNSKQFVNNKTQIMSVHLRKKKGLFVIEVVSDVNGKVLTTSRGLSQKVSVATNIKATMKDLGAKKGAKVTVMDETLNTPKEFTVKI